jgi:hypothetical protein
MERKRALSGANLQKLASEKPIHKARSAPRRSRRRAAKNPIISLTAADAMKALEPELKDLDGPAFRGGFGQACRDAVKLVLKRAADREWIAERLREEFRSCALDIARGRGLVSRSSGKRGRPKISPPETLGEARNLARIYSAKIRQIRLFSRRDEEPADLEVFLRLILSELPAGRLSAQRQKDYRRAILYGTTRPAKLAAEIIAEDLGGDGGIKGMSARRLMR